MLSDKDNGETLTRVWNSNALQPTTRQRAARLLAVTVETNPRAEEVLLSIFSAEPTDPQLCQAALAGIISPEVSTKLATGATPHVRPDYNRRLSMVEMWHSSVSDTQMLALIERAQANLAQRAGPEEPPAQ